MTLDEWWEKHYGNRWVNTEEAAYKAWDYQQTIIDELQYLNGLQEKHIAQLQTKLRAKYGSNSEG